MDFRPKESSAVFFLLLIFTLSKISEAQSLCSAGPVSFIKENNPVNAIVTPITVEDGVAVRITSQVPEGLFSLDGNNLIAVTVLDFETFDKDRPHEVRVECTKVDSPSTTLTLKIIVEDVNDNPPAFAESQYSLNVDELLKLDTSVGLITATDPDETDRLYYRLDSPEGEFGLQADFNPNILVKKLLDYDKVKKITMTLYAQDTQIGSTAEVSHTASTTIEVNIVDIDNRPPWFQPCTEIDFATSKVCMNSGYEGTVNLNEQEAGPLSLKPGPVVAIDGDKGKNEVIRYTFLEDTADPIFQINIDTGSITMLKPVGEAGPIVLTVMAYQKENPDQFSTTTVILKVVISSNYPPKFVKPSYEGFISEDAGVDSLVLESKTSNRPLRVQATDEDFSNGYNPDIKFEVVDGTDFSITPEGFILMAKTVTPGTVNLQMRVFDTNNDESSTASLTVEVTQGVPTTTPVTTIMTSSIITTDQTTDTQLTAIPSTATSTSHPGPNTTLPPSTGGQQGKAGEYSAGEMAAVGASLAVVLLLCLVGIGVMAHRIKGHNADWKKLSEASIFRSSLGGGSGGPKEGMQYSNEGFQHDGDSGSVNSKLAAHLENKLESGLRSGPAQENMTRSAAPVPHTSTSTPPDSSSLADSETVDGEKEVKPILTKERRSEEGYKAVWFKQDIDPNTKEDVVIIPDTGEPEGDQEEDDDSEDEDNILTDVDSEDEEL
ncbi:cadherin-related family member 5 isoform X1 [Rhinichthys klamathensis goyatoka]|uniref:cadherin-related family member 5 isoform X1 n=1 Tax=Rhinichthys klamathensis goyatoka TaxID=3034132 RepID=UPI0024B5D741|nr:cadherin-related family member 5 isoform X1 [Rhinichthys klamathensis goyatoka]